MLTEAAASRERVVAETGISATGAERAARETVTRDEVASGRAGVAAETDRPFAEHATESVPVIGGWFAGRLFGTAGNAAPDGGPDVEGRSVDEGATPGDGVAPDGTGGEAVDGDAADAGPRGARRPWRSDR